MRPLLLSLLLLLLIFPALASTQDLHTFSNGEVADAEKINENFQYVLENATGSGGCSAEQDGSNVVITCADGTSGVLTGAGTVVIYPEGVIENLDPFSYNTGDIVIVDANDEILGLSKSGARWQINGYYLDLGEFPRAVIYNDSQSGEVRLTAFDDGLPPQIWYLTPDCSGPVWLNVDFAKDLLGYYIAEASTTVETLLFESRKYSDRFRYTNEIVGASDCETLQFTGTARRGSDYTPAAQVVNASYPARLKQLP